MADVATLIKDLSFMTGISMVLQRNTENDRENSSLLAGIRIIIKSGDGGERVLVNTLVEDAEQISIKFYLKSPDGADKVLVQTLIEDTKLSLEMQDQLENVLSEGEFTVVDGQLRMKLQRTGYTEEPEEKILSNL